MAVQDIAPPLPPGCGALSYIIEWFVDVSRGRTLNIVSGPTSMDVIYNSISCSELAAWAQLTGNMPTVWEISVIRSMDSAFVAGKSGKENKGSKHQGLGDYCHGDEVEKCRVMFGDQLERVCATCPN